MAGRRLELRHAPDLSYAPGPITTMPHSGSGDKMAVRDGFYSRGDAMGLQGQGAARF